MTTNGPAQGGVGGAPPPPIVQQTTVIQVGGQKSVGLAVLLAFLFGPLGMLYATVLGGVVMFFVNIVVAILTLGLGLFLTIPLGMLWAGIAASSHNKQLQAISAQSSAGQGTAAAVHPAAWYDDPDGSGRLRFFNGTSWTDRYSDKPSQQPAGEPAQPTASRQPRLATAEIPDGATDELSGDDEELAVVLKSSAPDKATCESCGHDVDGKARFCSACGAARTVG